MNKTRKRMASIIAALAAVSCIAAVPAAGGYGDIFSGISISASAAGTVSYTDAAGDTYSLSSYKTIKSGTTKLTSGWYVVSGSVTVNSRINVTGDVSLILTDGAVLTAKEGIGVASGCTFNVYTSAGSSGTLYAGTTTGYNSTASSGNCGIGGSKAVVNIYGGSIYAVGGGNEFGIKGSSVNLGWTNPYDTVRASSYSGKISTVSVFADKENGEGYNIGRVSATDIEGAVLSAAYELDGTFTELNNAAYVVFEKFTMSKRLNVTGTVDLILAEGSALKAKGGINVSDGNTLYINGHNGKLYAGTSTGSDSTAAAGYSGIGGVKGSRTGSISILGGNVYAAGGAGAYGIGGSDASVGLSWTHGTDSIYATSYSGDISFYSLFVNTKDGTIFDGSKSVSSLGGKTLSALTVIDSQNTVWNDGWYIATGSTVIDDRAYVDGTVNLLLDDKCTLKVLGGIDVSAGDKLNILARSANLSTMGTLYAGTGNGSSVSAASGSAGIGSSNSDRTGDISIQGGKIYASGGSYAAGIGGSSNSTGGTVTINSAAVSARGGYGAAGIGGGQYGRVTSVVLKNSDISAQGGEYGAGIGSGYNCENGNVEISGSTVNANGGSYAAGIGGGRGSAGGSTQIYSGRITAYGGTNAAGIGAGYGSSNAYITLGWQNSGDSIYASSYNGTVKLTDNFKLKNSGYTATSSNIDGETIIPGTGKTNDYIVTYYVDGTKYKVQTYAASSTKNVYAYAPANPVKSGYSFVGWYTDRSLRYAYNFNTPLTSDLTLYAAFTADSTYYTVKFTSAWGDNYGSQSVKKGQYAYIPDAPTKKGYMFNGWYTDKLCTKSFNFNTKITKNITLYAGFEYIESEYCTVKFTSDKGDNLGTQTVKYGSRLNIPTAPTRIGYEFVGWYTDLLLEDLYDFSDPVYYDMTLYAGFIYIPDPSPAFYTVKFTSDKGDIYSTQSVQEGGYPAAVADPSRVGYEFKGWYTDLLGTTPFSFSAPVYADTTVYAVFDYIPSPTYYTVTFTSDKGDSYSTQTVSEGACAKEFETPTRTGYEFKGWYTDIYGTYPFSFSTPIYSDLTVYAVFEYIPEPTPTYHTVTFTSDKGEDLGKQSVEDGSYASSISAPSRTGYEFKGWYTDMFGNNPFSFSTPIYSDVTVYALYEYIPEPVTHTVSFSTGGGSYIAPQTVNDGDRANDPGDPYQNGFIFLGWYSDASYSSYFSFSTPITRDITLYAKWEAEAAPQDTLYAPAAEEPDAAAVPPEPADPDPDISDYSAPEDTGSTFGGAGLIAVIAGGVIVAGGAVTAIILKKKKK